MSNIFQNFQIFSEKNSNYHDFLKKKMKKIQIKYKSCVFRKSKIFRVGIHYSVEHCGIEKISMSLHIAKCGYRSSTSNFIEMIILKNF